MMSATFVGADEWDAPANYYSSVTGTGATLKSQLTSAMSAGHIQRRYGDFRYSAAIHDADPNNPGNILLGYNRASVSANWDSGSTWNREHVWPQSRQPGSASNSTKGNLGDPHALRPLNPGINSSRGNKPFGLDGTTGSFGHQGSYYFPGDTDKGDVARALFYSDTRWSSQGLSLTDAFPSGNQMGDLSSLVAWNYLDVPDEFERRRNHTISSSEYNPSYYTNNRNAYIDHPEYVWSVYVDQLNDSQLAVAGPGATGPDANGYSEVNLDFGSVLVASLPGPSTVDIVKSGDDGSYFEVANSLNAFSDITGRYNAFPVKSSGSPDEVRTMSVGFASPLATAGAHEEQITIDNLDVTTGFGSGHGANDADDLIRLSVDVLDHATPSFAGGLQTTALSHDFGTVSLGASDPTFQFDIFNLVSTVAFTAGLELDSIFGSGDTGSLFTDLATFGGANALDAGLSTTFTATLDTDIPGTFSASYTLGFSDVDLLGAAGLGDLTLTLMGVVASGLLGDTDTDGDVDAADIELLFASFASTDPLFDIAQNGGAADQSDMDALVRDVLDSEYGDANLDGSVDPLDFSILSGNFNATGGWADGDFNGDGMIDPLDFSLLSGNFGFGTSEVLLTGEATDGSVPEPHSVLCLACSALLFFRRRRRYRCR